MAASLETDTDDVMERIREVGGQLVIVDTDLADLYGVTTAELRALVRQNKVVFAVEFAISVRLDGARTRALAFTEYGVIVAASLLGDPGIEAVSIHLVRAFVKLRESNSSDGNLIRRIEALDKAVNALDSRIRREFVAVYEALGMKVTIAPPDSSATQKLH